MFNPKLIRILKSLSPDEFKDLGKFVQSPFHNESKKLINLYNSLKRFYPDFDRPLCNKEYLFKCIYEDENYNDDKFRNQFSLMLKLTEEYISCIELKRDFFNTKKYLLTQLGNRNLMDIFIQEFEIMNKSLEKNTVKDEEHFLNLFLLEKIKRKSFESKTLAGKSKSLYENILWEFDCLNNFFLISMLKEYFKLDNAKRVLNVGFRYKVFDAMIKYIEANLNEYQDVPYINVFFKFISEFKANKNESSYKILKEMLKFNSENLNKEDSKDLYTELYNYCKSLQSSENRHFGKESFNLINEMLSKGLLFENDGSLHVQTYINFAASAIRENELIWAEEFIIKYKERLHPEHQDDAYNYNYAVLLYKKGRNDIVNKKENFERSLTRLSKVQSDDCYYYTRIKNLQLILYYELENYESALYLIDTYIHYLSKDKVLPVDVKERYLNFTKFLHRLINIKLNDSSNDVIQVKKDLKNNHNVEYHNWLLEKTEESEVFS